MVLYRIKNMDSKEDASTMSPIGLEVGILTVTMFLFCNPW